jgi:glycogen synthase
MIGKIFQKPQLNYLERFGMITMSKILMIVEDFYPKNFGGIGTHAYNLAQNLSLKNQVTVLVGRTEVNKNEVNDEIYELSPNLKVFDFHLLVDKSLHYYPIHWSKLNNNFWDKVMKRNDLSLNEFDVIHLQDYHFSLIASGISEKYSVPIVNTIHSISPPNNHFIYYMRNFSIQNSSQLITVSKWMAEEIKKKYNVPNEFIHVIPNGVETDGTISNFHSKTHILFVGRLGYLKGIENLIETFARFLKLNDSFILDIIGEGEQEKNLKAIVTELDLDKNVIFHGYQDKKYIKKISKDSLFSVVPSIEEPFGMVALESMSYGVPVIASNVGGLKEIVKHGVNGLLFEARNNDDLLNKMQSLIKDKKMRNYLIESGFKTIKDYKWEIISKKTEKIYKDANFKNLIGKETAYHYLW